MTRPRSEAESFGRADDPAEALVAALTMVVERGAASHALAARAVLDHLAGPV